MAKHNLTQAWLTPKAKNRLKAKASILGISLSEYLENISKTSQKEDKKTSDRYGGFF